MKELSNNQIEKINKHLSKMTEAQQDVYIQKLEEAGLLDKILGSFGSPSKNLEKLKKQRDATVQQINAMIKAIQSSTAVQDQNKKNADIQALQNILTELGNVNLDIKIDETPAKANNNQSGTNNQSANNNQGEEKK